MLANSDDNILRVYNLPARFYGQSVGHEESETEMFPVLRMKEAELIYDYCWYPKMSSNDPDTCLFASSSTDNPIHVWDAFTGQIRCTFKTYNFAVGASYTCLHFLYIRNVLLNIFNPYRRKQFQPTAWLSVLSAINFMLALTNSSKSLILDPQALNVIIGQQMVGHLNNEFVIQFAVLMKLNVGLSF